MPANNSFYLSTRAESDIEALFEKTCEQIGLGSAEGLVLDLSIAFRRLSQAGDNALDCSYISEGLKAWRVNAQMIYYRHQDDGVNVLRVLPADAHVTQVHTIQ